MSEALQLEFPKDYGFVEGVVCRPGIANHLAALATHIASSEGKCHVPHTDTHTHKQSSEH
jgi:hypothetical protein